jgi:hypothetical protein
MNSQDNGQSGYYQTIARAFLRRRGAPLLLSPKDQAVIAAWEEKRVPLDIVLEGIGRTFEGLRVKGRGGTRGLSLTFCVRQVEGALAQYRDRSAGGKSSPATRPGKREKARREVEKGRLGLPPGDTELARLLDAALAVLAEPEPDETALERIDAEIEEVLWNQAPDAERRADEAEAREEFRGRRSAGLEAAVRRKVVKTARNARKIPHVALFYY